MRERGLVTVAVLAYNHSAYVRQCLESLAAQTHGNLEIVFMDDGSSDDTFPQGKMFLEKLGIRHHAVQSKDNFISRNLNLALSRYASGEYFAIISADDWWEPANLSLKARYLDEHPDVPLVYSPIRYHFEATGEQPEMGKPYAEGRVFDSLLKDNFIAAHSALIRRSVFDEVGPYDERSKIEDWDMWLRIAKVHPIGFINHSLGFYRIHGSNMSKKERLMLESSIYILGKHLDHPIAREKHRKALVYHSVKYQPAGLALASLKEYGVLDAFSIRQSAKLLFRFAKTGAE